MLKIYYNNEKTLMIHSYSSSYYYTDNISINLDNIWNHDGLTAEFINNLKKLGFTSITFDDGLFCQIPLIKEFRKNFKDVYFFPSGKFIRNENTEPVIIENSLAHKQYHKEKTYPSTFMSSTEIWDLLSERCKFGIHGWHHYNMNPIILPTHVGSKKFKDIMLALKDDAAASIGFYIDLIKKEPKYFITNGCLNLNYCTPYNCLSEYQKIYIDFLTGFIERDIIKNEEFKRFKIIEVKLTIFSSERIPLEKILEGENHAVK